MGLSRSFKNDKKMRNIPKLENELDHMNEKGLKFKICMD